MSAGGRLGTMQRGHPAPLAPEPAPNAEAPNAETPSPTLQAARCRTGRADHASARGAPVRGEGPSTAMRQGGPHEPMCWAPRRKPSGHWAALPPHQLP